MSDEKILTLNNFNRSNSVRFTAHEVLGKKPVQEYLGQSLDTITFDISLKASNGVNPVDVMNQLIVLQREGALISIFIGDMAFGMFRWVIKDLSNDFKHIDNKGNTLAIDINISLEEYV